MESERRNHESPLALLHYPTTSDTHVPDWALMIVELAFLYETVAMLITYPLSSCSFADNNSSSVGKLSIERISCEIT